MSGESDRHSVVGNSEIGMMACGFCGVYKAIDKLNGFNEIAKAAGAFNLLA